MPSSSSDTERIRDLLVCEEQVLAKAREATSILEILQCLHQCSAEAIDGILEELANDPAISSIFAHTRSRFITLMEAKIPSTAEEHADKLQEEYASLVTQLGELRLLVSEITEPRDRHLLEFDQDVFISNACLETHTLRWMMKYGKFGERTWPENWKEQLNNEIDRLEKTFLAEMVKYGIQLPESAMTSEVKSGN